MTGGGERPSVLFVCTANRCRSPVAAALMARQVDGSCSVFSAGLLQGGGTMPSAGVRLGDEMGIDFRSHRSREIRAEDLTTADVVLGMTREHVRELVVRAPDLWPRVFTVKQFGRWVHEHPHPVGQPLRDWIESEAGRRPRSEMIGQSEDDDIADPVRSPLRTWRAMAREMDAAIRSIVGGLRLE